ncbi:hypothetical protein [Fibrella aquatica]|uniref:hypothetical protein n=1 Tax=Fibrella aquatica TaxID=3242487 RepID=UPI0035226FC6
MEPLNEINENNIVDLSSQNFINILRGDAQMYIFGYANSPAMGKASEDDSVRIAEAKREKPSYAVIRIPAFWNKQLWEHHYGPQYSSGKKPNPDKPFYTKINEEVYFYNQLKKQLPDGTYADEPNLKRGIDLKYCLFQGSFHLSNIVSDSFIDFNYCRISDVPKELHGPGEKLTIPDLIFSNSSFTRIKIDNIEAINGNSITELKLENTTASELVISNSKIRFLNITGSSKFEKIIVKNSIIQKIAIDSSEAIVCDIIGPNNIGTFNIKSRIQQLSFITDMNNSNTVIKRSSIEELHIQFNSQIEKSITILRDVDFESINVTGVHNGDTLFKNIRCSKLFVSNFSNTGNLRFHTADFTKFFNLQDASLGKTDFTQVTFSTTMSCNIIQSNVSEASISNTRFPSNIQAENHSGIREVYRQLKYASSKQNDRIQELAYEALEMDAYKNDKSNTKTWGDQVILITNRYSNNHGQDWRNAICGLLFVTTIAFRLIQLSLGYKLVIGFPSAYEVAQYLNFAFNPIHDFDKIFEKDNLGYARIIDNFAKLLSGYFLFQFLRAFRKYVK